MYPEQEFSNSQLMILGQHRKNVLTLTHARTHTHTHTRMHACTHTHRGRLP